jgi:hypothetical protein
MDRSIARLPELKKVFFEPYFPPEIPKRLPPGLMKTIRPPLTIFDDLLRGDLILSPEITPISPKIVGLPSSPTRKSNLSASASEFLPEIQSQPPRIQRKIPRSPEYRTKSRYEKLKEREEIAILLQREREEIKAENREIKKNNIALWRAGQKPAKAPPVKIVDILIEANTISVTCLSYINFVLYGPFTIKINVITFPEGKITISRVNEHMDLWLLNINGVEFIADKINVEKLFHM